MKTNCKNVPRSLFVCFPYPCKNILKCNFTRNVASTFCIYSKTTKCRQRFYMRKSWISYLPSNFYLCLSIAITFQLISICFKITKKFVTVILFASVLFEPLTLLFNQKLYLSFICNSIQQNISKLTQMIVFVACIAKT